MNVSKEEKESFFKKLLAYAAYAIITVVALNCIHIKIVHEFNEGVKLDHRTTSARVELNHHTPYGVTVR